MRVSMVAACAALFAAPALAQEAPPEDGLGPFRFGMSVEEARAGAPDAAWREESIEGRVALSGGPPAAVGGARMNMVLVFEADALERIVLAGASAHGCAETVTHLVEELEHGYGAFSSVAATAERGILADTRRTDAGSELRSYEASEDRPASVNATRRRDAMFIHVSGRQVASDEASCQLRVLFDRQAEITDSQVRDLVDRIDRAETVQLTREQWQAQPRAADYAAVYPHHALDRGLGGRGTLDCLVLEDGRLECLLVHEEPAGNGFGAAALAISAHFRADVRGENAYLIGKRLRRTIVFLTR